MSDPYSVERRARDLELFKHPERWPQNPIFLKRWKDGNMENARLYHASGEFRFYPDNFYIDVNKSGGSELCDQLVLAGWVAD